MGLLTRLFGDYGKVRFEGVCEDGTSFTGKTVIESFNNNTEELEEKLKEMMFIEYGKPIKTLKIVGYVNYK